MTNTRELTFRGLALCDACGGPLAKAERLAGVCAKCQAPAPRRQAPRAKPERPRRERHGDRDRAGTRT
jgi:predicted amidophosphoribosyltransferase